MYIRVASASKNALRYLNFIEIVHRLYFKLVKYACEECYCRSCYKQILKCSKYVNKFINIYFCSKFIINLEFW